MDEAFKSGAYMWETFQDPKTSTSEEPEDDPLNRAMNMHVPFLDWLEEPEQAYRLRRFGVAMRGLQSSMPADGILNGFDWKSLGENDVIADVGGGIGNAALPIARANPKVNILFQERPAVIEDGIKDWKQVYPEALSAGRTKFIARDLFGDQPVRDDSAFLLRRILHDWSDKYASKILTTLREAARRDTKLIIIDSILQSVCHDPNAQVNGIERIEASSPLLPNYGPVSAQTYGSDLIMFSMHNSQERTLAHLSRLLEGAGWRLVRVYPDPTNIMPQVEAVPI